jgi:hypothetical protein
MPSDFPALVAAAPRCGALVTPPACAARVRAGRFSAAAAELGGRLARCRAGRYPLDGKLLVSFSAAFGAFI